MLEDVSMFGSKIATALGEIQRTIKFGEEVNEKEAENRAQYELAKQRFEKELEVYNHLVTLHKSISDYAANHAEKNKSILQEALAAASSIVPNAQEGIELSVEQNSIVIRSKVTGQRILQQEGDGYGTAIGLMLLYALIKANKQAIPFLILDEYFFALSEDGVRRTKPFLEAIAKELNIIVISHRPLLLDGLSSRVYSFQKVNDDSIVTEVQ